MIIRKSALIQYVLIYLMMVYNGGVLYTVMQVERPIYIQIVSYTIIIVGFLAIFLNKKKYGNQYCLYISAILVIAVMIVRYTVGGVGLSALVDYLSCIMMVFLTAAAAAAGVFSGGIIL